MFKLNPKIFVAFCAFIMAITGPAVEGKLITVDDDAPANFSIIQDAINFASKGDEIEVRPGTYYQTVDFKGKAVRLYSRDGSAVTIIDANGAYHAVQCVSGEDANTVLDGFTITGGNANGTDPNDQCGGGMYCESSSPTVNDCMFNGNTADFFGGGMYNLDNSSPTVTNCTFYNNQAVSDGGGMYNRYSSSPTVTNCNFTTNSAIGGGGGMHNRYSSSPTVTNCNFTTNSAFGGGGMYNLDNSSPTVTNCAFSGNSAQFSSGDGGGMHNRVNSSPMVTNCIFWTNVAMWGGGMCNYINSSPTVTNCTFSNNECSNGGGGIFNSDNSSPTVTNCILWGNTPDQINDWDSPASSTTVSFSDVQGGWPGMLVMDLDPLFVNAAGGDLRLSSSASPCVDNGAMVTPGLPATDLAGNPRIVDGDRNGTDVVDMGAYEYQSWLIHNITRDEWYETIQFAIDAAVTGDEIEAAPGTYYEAIDFKGKAIRLYSSGGPDVTTIDANGLNSSVVTCNSGEDVNTILEGFTITGGSGTTVSGYKYGGGMYNYSSSPTVTDCIFSNNTANKEGGGMFNKYYSSPTVINCAFYDNIAAGGVGMYNLDHSSPTLTNCIFSNNTADTAGGGMYNNISSPTVTNCIFSNNTANTAGGGMFNGYGSSPTVTNCSFEDNEADAGGGMANYTLSSPKLTNCTFRANSARAAGGMNNYENSSPTVTNCIFTGNIANDDTGGMHNHAGSNAILTNCIFICNSAGNAGGGVQNAYSTATLTNCTFIGNTAVTDGGGIRNWDSNPTVTNCILWGNEPDEISSGGTSVPVVNYSDVQGGHIGTGNINTDPNFVDANNPDPNLVNLRLLPVSECIDAGDSTAVPSGIFLDADGNPRGLDDPASPDTGVSVLGVTVDMGAYEFQPCPIPGDINCDGVVDFKDVAILCENWLAGTEP
jgi:parallel beta-helix repeat protein